MGWLKGIPGRIRGAGKRVCSCHTRRKCEVNRGGKYGEVVIDLQRQWIAKHET